MVAPGGGVHALTLGTAQFEICWGTQAKSRKVPYSETGILQVNARSGNTRDVKGELKSVEGEVTTSSLVSALAGANLRPHRSR